MSGETGLSAKETDGSVESSESADCSESADFSESTDCSESADCSEPADCSESADWSVVGGSVAPPARWTNKSSEIPMLFVFVLNLFLIIYF